METRAYRSKIGRLPFAIRNELNERIRDGMTGAELLKWLNGTRPMAKMVSEGVGEVNAQNLTDWRSTGYADWLRSQEAADRVRSYAEASSAIAAAAGGNVASVGCNILTGRILEFLEGSEPDPKAAADLAKALVSFRNSENAERKVALAKEHNDLQKEQLELAQLKFERDTCRLFIKWAADNAALSIATNAQMPLDEKTEKLGRMMFGDAWKPQD